MQKLKLKINSVYNNISVPNITGNQAVSLRSFPLFRSAAPVGRSFLRSADTIQPQKKQQLENKQLFFCAASFLISTRALPVFAGASTSIIQLHSVTLRKLRSTAFQPYFVCRPMFFQRLLLRTAIGLGAVHINLVESLFQLNIIHGPLYIVRFTSP
jgi:hypothetical protein